MEPMYYIGLDVHKRKISYCVKDGSGAIQAEGTNPATRIDLDHWMKILPQLYNRPARRVSLLIRTLRAT
jgi:transposase